MPARFRDPIAWSRLLQLVKTVAAAVIAWEVALHVLDLQQPFLAPWAAVLTVHATVYRTFRRGAQQVGASVLGVLLAFAAVGLLVNLLVWAPIGDRIAARHVDAIDDRIGALLIDLAAGLRETAVDDDALEAWTDRTRDIDRDIDEGWGVVRQARESALLNPRRRASERAHAVSGFEPVLGRLEQANAEIRSMIRTILIAGTARDTWDLRF